ncbi:HlyD family secretion protein/membrane fusion protein, macrolide-specific efflux system [Selenomonas ruminantium]|uniref:HlyD family secretion protein/membrane fusion protein, macrolide-specific efflux system n=1 Tax=Selenomonas ruminantium TaxID=971 RepID=A0A1M6XSI0_SELRU|nr:efflux RND transporter periplasmic adaptor subunit [Selenomonas ruminantium]SHL08957.1 HlyD family secretion protein/membrane fusion protein, macrolide-specific efflux system [Selenomonas ruminantium]
MKFDWKVKTAIVVVLLVAAGIGGYRYYQGQQEVKKLAAVETTPVTRMTLKSTVSATGTIRPVDSVEVSSKVTARIKDVLVKENDTVTAGQVVATLDAQDYEEKRNQAQYKVTNTKAKYDRVKYLYSIGADTQEELEDAKMNYDTAVSSLAESQSNMNEMTIVAPMSGVVVGEPQTPGTMAVQGTSSPTVIMRIADLSRKQILAKVDETDIGNVKVGQTATFTVDSFNGKTFTARVSKISQTDTSNTWNINTSSGSSSSSSSSASVIYYYVTLDVDDPDNVLLPSMTARVEINTAEKNDALVVPLSTLKTDANGSYVVIKNADGSQENRYVSTGIYSDEYVEILEGLSEGEQVVSTYVAKGTAGAKKNSNNRGGPPPM